jgi:hypothetical protein
MRCSDGQKECKNQATAQILVATQYGMELGLSPMAALNSICVVRSKPSLWGDAALALVKKSGLCEYVKETIEGVKDGRFAKVISKRKDTGEVVTTEFSVSDAIQAKLWNKTGPWTTHPDRMLKYKARAFNLRDNFPDVLMGMHITEELYGEEPLPVPECETPTRENRRKVESIKIADQICDETIDQAIKTEETLPEETEQLINPLYDEVLAKYNELATDDTPFVEWAAFALCVEEEELEEKINEGAFTWLLKEMNTKGSVRIDRY